MEGIKVVDVGMWVAGPAAAGILGDWGADVIKIEPPEGDPFRALLSGIFDGVNPPFELDNRNKRSVGLNLSLPEGRAVAADLVDRADVFVTNARPAALERAGLDRDGCAQPLGRPHDESPRPHRSFRSTSSIRHPCSGARRAWAAGTECGIRVGKGRKEQTGDLEELTAQGVLVELGDEGMGGGAVEYGDQRRGSDARLP